MSVPASSSRAFRSRASSDGRAGALAALLVLFLDLLWRVTLAPTGAQSIPESVVAAVARLTPTALFGWATESFGSLAQNTLWAVVLLGVVGMGYWAGQVAGQLARLGHFRPGITGRFGAGLIMAAVLFLIIAVGIFPLAREGVFAAGSVNQGTLLAQGILFAAVWAVAWAALGGVPVPSLETAAVPAAAESISRRSALRSVAAGGLAAGVAYLGWRLARAPSTGDVVARQQAAAEIAARAQVAAPSAAGAAPATSAGAESPDLAPVAPDASDDVALAQWDPSPEEPFAELEAEGKLTPVITSVADFYHVSKNISDPVVDGASWTLTIEGMVATPLSFSYDDIAARAKTQNITTLSCISNELNGDLAGTAEWTGLPLRELLEEAGVDPKTVDIVFRAADGYDDSIPLAQAMHPTTLLVTGMNGEPLPPDHGFPARLIVPRLPGTVDRATDLRDEEREVGRADRSRRPGLPGLLADTRLERSRPVPDLGSHRHPSAGRADPRWTGGRGRGGCRWESRHLPGGDQSRRGCDLG
ncbi:MAG: molybdopterin-binding oxidoreductase [Thermomicrobiales bacterium]|nr:molybdopterin-binding oxidoreductase [Thermomicrobiales bacterium]